MTLTQAIQEALSGVPDRVLGKNAIVFTLTAKNGGRGKVEVNVKGYGDRWFTEQREYDLRFLKVSVRQEAPKPWDQDSGGEVILEFGLCPFEDGAKVARKLAPPEVLEHVDADQITQKLKAMIAQVGDMRFNANAPTQASD